MAIKIYDAFLTKLQMTNDGSYNEIQDLTGTAAIISASAEGGGSSDIPSGWSATTSSVDNSSPVGSYVTSQKHYRLESLDDNGTVTHLGSGLPYNGFADSAADILQYQGNNYSGVSNLIFYTDQSSLIVGAFLADYQGTFFNSNDTHNTTYEQEYAYFNTAKYAAIKTNSLRSSSQSGGHTINEDTIIKVEQYNGYLRITQILTINS